MNTFNTSTLVAIRIAAAQGDFEVAYDLMFRDPDILALMDRLDLTACEMLEHLNTQ